MGPVGAQEMVIIFIVALVLFGPKKLPELGRTIGKALTQFRRASADLKASFEREMQKSGAGNRSGKAAGTGPIDGPANPKPCRRNTRVSVLRFRLWIGTG